MLLWLFQMVWTWCSADLQFVWIYRKCCGKIRPLKMLNKTHEICWKRKSHIHIVQMIPIELRFYWNIFGVTKNSLVCQFVCIKEIIFWVFYPWLELYFTYSVAAWVSLTLSIVSNISGAVNSHSILKTNRRRLRPFAALNFDFFYFDNKNSNVVFISAAL